MPRQYTFRTKTDSKLEQMMTALLDRGARTQEDLRELGFSWNDVWCVWSLSRYCDNLSINNGNILYTDVVPNTVVNVQGATFAGPMNGQVAQAQAPEASPDVEQVRFPGVPVIHDPMDNFRKPSWFEPMRTAVRAGKHISLSGPPGIGKSTAVEQLAAEEHMPLVHIGADAGLRRRDLTGNVELINGHTSFMVAEYAAAAVFGWWAVIDEANAAEPDAIMSLNGQIAPPYTVQFYGKSAPVHPNFRLFITYNHGLVGTKPLPDSFKDRFFPIKLGFPTDLQLRNILLANGMPEDSRPGADDSHSWNTISSAIIKYARLTWEAYEQGRMRYQITPRRLMDAVFLLKAWDSGTTNKVAEALDMAVINAVDNMAEVKQLQSILVTVKMELMNGRL